MTPKPRVHKIAHAWRIDWGNGQAMGFLSWQDAIDWLIKHYRVWH